MTESSKRSSVLRLTTAPARAVSHASWLYPFKVQMQLEKATLINVLTRKP